MPKLSCCCNTQKSIILWINTIDIIKKIVERSFETLHIIKLCHIAKLQNVIVQVIRIVKPQKSINEIEINIDKSPLDINFINEFISNSYWAKGGFNRRRDVSLHQFEIYSSGTKI